MLLGLYLTNITRQYQAKLSADIPEYDNREHTPTCKAYYRGKTISYCFIIPHWLWSTYLKHTNDVATIIRSTLISRHNIKKKNLETYMRLVYPLALVDTYLKLTKIHDQKLTRCSDMLDKCDLCNWNDNRRQGNSSKIHSEVRSMLYHASLVVWGGGLGSKDCWLSKPINPQPINDKILFANGKWLCYFCMHIHICALLYIIKPSEKVITCSE